MPSHNSKVFVKRLRVWGANERNGKNPYPAQSPREPLVLWPAIFLHAEAEEKGGKTPPPPESDKKTLITLSYVTFLYLCATKVSRTHLFQANRFGGVCGWVVQWFDGSVVQWVAVAFSAAPAAVSLPLLFAAILQFSFASSPSRFFSASSFGILSPG